MDFKSKFKLQFKLNKQGTGSVRSPLSPTTSTELSTALPAAASEVAPPPPRPVEVHDEDEEEPEVSDDVLSTIEPVYYDDDAFDATDYVLHKLPAEVDGVDHIQVERRKLRRQLRVVSARVSTLILQKEAAYVNELRMVHQLQNNLQEALTICYEARRGLADAQQQFTVASLGILANYYKRQQLMGILRSLQMIKTLQQTDVRLRELLEEEDYPGAINLCLACQKAVLTFRYYRCISELSLKLQDTIVMIEEQLDVALSRVCSCFVSGHYEKLQMAYALLGKTQMAMDQLHMHFTTAIHNTAFTIVLGYVRLCTAKADTSFHKRQYHDLCKMVTSESFMACLIELCKSMWHIVHSYHRVMEWHERQDASAEADDGLGLEANFNRRYIRQKLEHGLGRVWQDVRHKVKAFLVASDLLAFKFDDFIRVLDIVNRLVDIGEEFCGSKSDDLRESVRRQSINYFRNYHRVCVDELRTFLEHESWELCPVKPNFTIYQLVEFRFLRHSKPSSPCDDDGDEDTKTSDGFFQRFYDGGNPFGYGLDTAEEDADERVPGGSYDDDQEDSDSDESDVPEELKQDFVDEQTGEVPPASRQSKVASSRNLMVRPAKGQQTPILTNTTLNVLRLFGKYIQMMTVLKPIAFDVLICMSQLFEYYMFAVYIFFATDVSEVDVTVSDKLRASLARIGDNLVYDADGSSTVPLTTTGEVPGDGGQQKDKVPKPTLSPVVNLSGSEGLYGLAERMAASESLVFLYEQLSLLRGHLNLLIPVHKQSFLQQFYSYTVSVAPELRRPIYMAVAARAIDYEHMLSLMANVRWDIGDIMSQHSPYVDILLREMQVFCMRLSQVSRRVPVPHEAYNILWGHCILLTNKTLVEGFASARRCSNEGRALMQLDLQQYLMKLEKMVDVRPIPGKDYVESYVKAFYLPENILEEWINGHKEYSARQLASLLNCVTHINKKTRQRLLLLIDDSARK